MNKNLKIDKDTMQVLKYQARCQKLTVEELILQVLKTYAEQKQSKQYTKDIFSQIFGKDIQF